MTNTWRNPTWDERLMSIKSIAERHWARLHHPTTDVSAEPASYEPKERVTEMPTLPAGSILLGSSDAGQLKAWYQKVIAPDHSGDGPLTLGGLWLVIEQRDDVSAVNPEPGRSILNFHVDDFTAYQVQLDEAGVEWVSAPEDRPSGRFGTFKDPDGNYLQLIQLN